MSVTELERLRDRVAVLEEALGLKTEFPPNFKMQPRCKRLFGMILNREIVPYESALLALFPSETTQHGTDPSARLINVYACKLRKALRRYGISVSTHWGVGLYMTAEEKRKARAVLDKLWAEVRA